MSWFSVLTVYVTVKPNYAVDLNRLRKALVGYCVSILPGANNKLVKVWTLVKNGHPSHLETVCETIRKTISDSNLFEIDGDIRGEDGFSEMNMEEAGVKRKSILWKFDGIEPRPPPLDKEVSESKLDTLDNTPTNTSTNTVEKDPTNKQRPDFGFIYGVKMPLHYIIDKCI